MAPSRARLITGGSKPPRPMDNVARVGLMRCRDFLWEFAFMRRMAPKANLLHEDLFHVPFAMFIAAGGVSEAARDALIAE